MFTRNVHQLCWLFQWWSAKFERQQKSGPSIVNTDIMFQCKATEPEVTNHKHYLASILLSKPVISGKLVDRHASKIQSLFAGDKLYLPFGSTMWVFPRNQLSAASKGWGTTTMCATVIWHLVNCGWRLQPAVEKLSVTLIIFYIVCAHIEFL